MVEKSRDARPEETPTDPDSEQGKVPQVFESGCDTGKETMRGLRSLQTSEAQGNAPRFGLGICRNHEDGLQRVLAAAYGLIELRRIRSARH